MLPPQSLQTHAWPEKADGAAQLLAVYRQSEHCPPMLIREHVFKTPSAVLPTTFTSILHLHRTEIETLHLLPLVPSLHLPSPAPPLIPPGKGLRMRSSGPSARHDRRGALINLPTVTAWPSTHRGMSRRTGVGMNTVCGFELDLNSIFLILRCASPRREDRTSNSTRPRPWVMYILVGAWPLLISHHRKKVRPHDALMLAWLVAFSPMYNFSPAMPEIPSVWELGDDGTGKVVVFVLNMIEPGAGIEDIPEVPLPHNLSTSLLLHGVAQIPSLVQTNVRKSSIVDMLEVRQGWLLLFKSGYYGDVLAMAAQPARYTRELQHLLNGPNVATFTPQIKHAGLDSRRIQPVRSQCPQCKEGAQALSAHLPEVERRRSGVAAVHPHAAQGHGRARHRLDVHDPAGPGGMQTETWCCARTPTHG
ncbi:hypothetical protein EDB87DRAFT_1578475 [Lactarius vividus]|nr:hypothetical protein EDB87DRAFT_1578475 [Lactarius vividus]